MLKVLRDDLRQVIDVDSSSDVNAPETPVLWLAPLRHRFGMLVEELGMHIQWQVDAQWLQRPTTLQCMAMARFLEEAFSNVLKHSRASHIQVQCHQPDVQSWVVSITDDGVGFDVAAVEAAGMGIGMHSMHTRLGKVNGSLQVASSPQGTTLTASITLPTNHIERQITSENIAASA